MQAKCLQVRRYLAYQLTSRLSDGCEALGTAAIENRSPVAKVAVFVVSVHLSAAAVIVHVTPVLAPFLCTLQV